jgi:Tol biopolymer transport system component
LVSTSWTGPGSGNGSSRNPWITKDGQWVIFESCAQDLVTISTSPLFYQVYAKNLVTQQMKCLSTSGFQQGYFGFCYIAGVSANDKVVLYTTISNEVYVSDLASGTNRLVCTGCGNPSISGDGRFVAYEGTNAPGGGKTLWLADLQSNWAGTRAPGNSPLLTYDARYLIFASKADNLVEGDTNGLSDLFVQDTILGDTILVSTSYETGGPAQGVSARPILGADGRTVIFQSFAPDLAPWDYNGNRDWFVLSLYSEDSDGDGMDDDWEMAYFGTLSRDGTGDFDGDGRTDLQEFICGTVPTNESSVLRVWTMVSFGTGERTILWNALPGRTYRVQFKNSISDSAWHDLPGEVTASSGTGSKVDNSAGMSGQRYYRVVLAP